MEAMKWNINAALKTNQGDIVFLRNNYDTHCYFKYFLLG